MPAACCRRWRGASGATATTPISLITRSRADDSNLLEGGIARTRGAFHDPSTRYATSGWEAASVPFLSPGREAGRLATCQTLCPRRRTWFPRRAMNDCYKLRQGRHAAQTPPLAKLVVPNCHRDCRCNHAGDDHRQCYPRWRQPKPVRLDVGPCAAAGAASTRTYRSAGRAANAAACSPHAAAGCSGAAGRAGIAARPLRLQRLVARTRHAAATDDGAADAAGGRCLAATGRRDAESSDAA